MFPDEPAGDDPGPQVDRAAELREKWGVKTGDLWALGEHRLICGDCTDAATVARVMGGEKANGVFTSPPYAEQRASTYGGIPADVYVDWWEAIQANVRAHIADDGSFFVNIKPHVEDGERVLYVLDLVLAMKRRFEWRFVEEFCWKRNAVPGGWERRFPNGFEPIYQFSVLAEHKVDRKSVLAPYKESTIKRYEQAKKSGETSKGRVSSATGSGFSKNWDRITEIADAQGGAVPPNVIETSLTNNVDHPAAFPVGLPSFFIKAFSDENDIWLEPFSGSGTTLIACEQLSRRCRAVEISPGYVAVALERWAQMTGKTPVLLAHSSSGEAVDNAA